MDVFRKNRINTIIQMTLWLLMGSVLFITNHAKGNVYCSMLGIVLLIQGFPQLMFFILERKRYLYSFMMLIFGFFTCIFGVLEIKTIHEAELWMPLIISFVTLIHGFKELLMVFYICKQENPFWRYFLNLSIVTIAFATIMIFYTWTSQGNNLRLVGSVMIIDSMIEGCIWYIGEKKDINVSQEDRIHS